MISCQLNAQVRTDLGKGASRRLRRINKIPAILYGAEKSPMPLALEHHKVIHAQEREGFYTQILTININDKKIDVLLKDIQRHPYQPIIMHLDFLRIDDTHQITKIIPLHFKNKDRSAAVKAGAMIAQLINEVEVSCLPKDIPAFIEVDVENIQLGHPLHLSDLKLPKNVTLIELTKGKDHDQAVVIATTKQIGNDADDVDEHQAETTTTDT